MQKCDTFDKTDTSKNVFFQFCGRKRKTVFDASILTKNLFLTYCWFRRHPDRHWARGRNQTCCAPTPCRCNRIEQLRDKSSSTRMRSNGFKTQGAQGPQRCQGKTLFFSRYPSLGYPSLCDPRLRPPMSALRPQLTARSFPNTEIQKNHCVFTAKLAISDFRVRPPLENPAANWLSAHK